MPEISRFLGIVISMYHEDHAPPHFHARYSGFKARIAISDMEVLTGSLPPRVLGLVVEWAAIHQPELELDWSKAGRREPLDAIEPLR